MRAGGDVYQVIMGVWIEFELTREIEQLSINLLEVPCVFKIHDVGEDLGLG